MIFIPDDYFENVVCKMAAIFTQCFNYTAKKTVFPHWSYTVSVSVWLPEPARDREWKKSKKTLNDDFYHTTNRSAAIFGVQAVLSYLVLTLTLGISLSALSSEATAYEISVKFR